MKIDAKEFAKNWVNTWNSHDLDDILSHYSDDVEITSAMIKFATRLETGSLKGKTLIVGYWEKALIRFPDLHFKLIDVAEGVNSIALYYKSIMDMMSIEVMFFNEEGKVNKIFAHYTNR